MSTWDIKKQRVITDSLVYGLTGEKLKRSKTGRPFVKKTMDLSISHKENIVGIAIVPAPYKIGIDIESFGTRLNTKFFFGPVITNREFFFFKKFCENNNLSISSGIILFWSIKESFFKCLDYDLKPGKINILGISKNGGVRLSLSGEIRLLMQEKKLKLHSAKTVFENKNVFSQIIMKKTYV